MSREAYNQHPHSCPTCGNEVEYDDPSAPWCSEKCQRADVRHHDFSAGPPDYFGNVDSTDDHCNRCGVLNEDADTTPCEAIEARDREGLVGGQGRRTNRGPAMSDPVDLDALARSILEALPHSDVGAEAYDYVQAIKDEIAPLIAELRAARAVVEAAKNPMQWNTGGGSVTPRDSNLTTALAAYDAVLDTTPPASPAR